MPTMMNLLKKLFIWFLLFFKAIQIYEFYYIFITYTKKGKLLVVLQI